MLKRSPPRFRSASVSLIGKALTNLPGSSGATGSGSGRSPGWPPAGGAAAARAGGGPPRGPPPRHLRDGQRLEAGQELPGRRHVELRVGGLDAQEELVARGQGKARHVEERVV